MTLDFDPFWMFKMIGDPLLLIGDPKKISLVTPEGGHQGVTKKKHALRSSFGQKLLGPFNLFQH